MPSPGDVSDERWAHGAEAYRRVYGDDAVMMEKGQAAFFDLMIAHLFGEVWARPGLDLAARRLLVVGVLAAQRQFEALQLQFSRALELEELTAEQVREVVIQLVPYVGYPSSKDLFIVAEAAIAANRDDR